MSFFLSSVEAPELRLAVDPKVQRAQLLSKLQDTEFMVSCSPVANFKGPCQHPSAWIVTEAERVHGQMANTVGPPEYYTMTDAGMDYTTAMIFHANGYTAVIEAAMAVKLWLDISIVEEGGGCSLVEKMNAIAPWPLGWYLKHTFKNAHEAMLGNLKKRCEEAS